MRRSIHSICTHRQHVTPAKKAAHPTRNALGGLPIQSAKKIVMASAQRDILTAVSLCMATSLYHMKRRMKLAIVKSVRRVIIRVATNVKEIRFGRKDTA